jgi:serine/threonine protein kinase
VTQVPQPQPDPVIGRQVGAGYVITRKLGEGGMGSVYEAVHHALGMAVAVKVLNQNMPDDQRLRFVQEARAAAAIKDDNVIKIHDLGTFPEDGRPYFLMDLLQGHDLGAYVALVGEKVTGRFLDEHGAEHTVVVGHRIGVDFALRIFTPVFKALDAAHALKIVHRDLKPGNIFIKTSEDGIEPVVLDFGIAKLLEERMRVVAQTQTQAVMGTPGYMPPEQSAGQPVDARADVYAIGAVLYEVLCGRQAFSGPTVTAVIMQQVNGTPPAPHALVPAIPEALSRCIMDCLAVDPARRPQSIRQLVTRWMNSMPRGQGLAIVRELAPKLIESSGAKDPTIRASDRHVAPPAPHESAQQQATSQRRRGWIAAAAGVIGIAVILGVVLAAGSPPEDKAVVIDAGAPELALTIDGGAPVAIVADAGPPPPDAATVVVLSADAAVLVPTEPVPVPVAPPAPTSAPQDKLRPGKLSIKASPWADCVLDGPGHDGKEIGTTPITGYALKPGKYKLTLKHQKGADEIRFAIEPGQHRRIEKNYK